VSKPRGGRAARHAAGDGASGNNTLPTQTRRPPDPDRKDRPDGSQNDTTGGTDWPSGAW
jgi:hypothetical protein